MGRLRSTAALIATALTVAGCAATPPSDSTPTATAATAAKPSPTPIQLDLTGRWSWHDAPDPAQTMTAMITPDRIEIRWPSFEVGEEGDAMSGIVDSPIYWAGSFSPPPPGQEEYTFMSAGDTAVMEKSMLGSSEPEKQFRFADGAFSFELSVQGETKTLTLERD